MLFKDNPNESTWRWHPGNGREVVGYFALHPVQDDGSIEFSYFHIPNPKFRNMGYGRLMLLELIEEAKNRKAKRILCAVSPENFIAQKLYERCGFIKDKYYNNNYIMYLKLSRS